MPVKTLATLETEFDTCIAALQSVKDTLDTMLAVDAEGQAFLDESNSGLFRDSYEFARSMQADLAKAILKLTGYKAQAAVRRWPTS